MAFRVGVIGAFLVSVITTSVYTIYLAFHDFRPLGSMLAILVLSVLLSWISRTGSQVGLGRKCWWAPLAVAAISMAFFSYHNYTLNQLDHLAFTISLLLLSVGVLIVYSLRKKPNPEVTD